MIHQELQWTASNGKKIFGQYWKPDALPKAVVCLVHGFGEHSSRYEHVASFLCDHGYALITYDIIGHGKTEGKRGDTPSYDFLLEQVNDLYMKANEIFPGIPQFSYGHSLGANLMLNYLIRKKLAGLKGIIVSSPLFRLPFEPPKAQVLLGKIMMKIYPSFTQSSKLDPTAISSIPEEVKKYEDDPLIHDLISPMMFFPMIEAGKFAIANANEVQIPMLHFHGSADQLTSYAASVEFSKRKTGDYQFKSFEAGFHEMHNEPNRREVLAMIVNWMDNHLV